MYDGNLAYEEKYLATYLQCPDSIVLLALDGSRVVGASTGIPLVAETEEFQRPFLAANIDPASSFYCGESVLLPEYRGQGIYRQFFHGRENHARALGCFKHSYFCAVMRPAEHPRRPTNYQPLDAVWRHFGYTPQANLMTNFSWQDLDEDAESPKPMMFWGKAL